MFSINWSKVTD